MTKIAVLIACFNRKQITLGCIQNVLQSNINDTAIDIFVVDGGSTDGTVLEIRHKYPQVNITTAPGLYWNQGMILAWSNALNSATVYDGYLLLNDDVHIHENAIIELIEIVAFWQGSAIAVGFTISPTTGAVTYGGLKRKGRFSRIRFEKTSSLSDEIVTMNGNCVLIPKQIYSKLGMLNPKYRHSLGDIDYGLRATNFGFGIKLTHTPVAYLEENRTVYSGSSKINIREIYTVMKNPKGVPINEWFYFTKKHAGPFWFLNFFIRYLKMFKFQ